MRNRMPWATARVSFAIAAAGCVRQPAPQAPEVKLVTPAPLPASSAGVVSEVPDKHDEDSAVPAQCASVALLEGGPCTRQQGLTEGEAPFFEALATNIDVSDVSVKVTVDPRPAKVGTPLTVVVTYTNETDRSIALDFRQGTLSKKRGDNLFGYTVLDKKGQPAESPPGRSPCCPPGNTFDYCGDVPLENPSLSALASLRVVLRAHGQATVTRSWAPTRKKYGPKASLCPPTEIGPLLPGDYAMEVELPWHPNLKGTPPRTARADFSIGK